MKFISTLLDLGAGVTWATWLTLQRREVLAKDLRGLFR